MKCQRIHEFVYGASATCYSPGACADFGYCRDRNYAGLPDEPTRKQWQAQDEEPDPDRLREDRDERQRIGSED